MIMNYENFSTQRKTLLMNLDAGKELSILELGMYDLTPYFKDDFDVSLTEAIMLNKNLVRGVRHLNNQIYFAPPQQDALEHLFKNNKIIISAPTSFGKTLIVKEYIYREKPSQIVYIVPTNALAYELEKSFKSNENFSEYTIFDKAENTPVATYDTGDVKSLFIGTQEKFLELGSHVFKEIDLFVIDEAYKLEESTREQRGYKLSETFLQGINKKSKKIILLSPQAKFKGFENYEFSTFESNFNSVEKLFIVLSHQELFNMLLKKGLTEKSILFCQSPMQINDSFDSLEIYLDSTTYNLELVNQLSADIHPDWSVVKLLEKGVLTHHGQMPKYVQNKMINLFNSDNNYNLLLGTNSISEGINTSTKNLFIHPEYNGVTTKLLLIKNTIGRAGRLGQYPVGHIFSSEKIEDLVSNQIIIELSVSKDDELLELENTKDDNKIREISEQFNLDDDFCKLLLQKYKLSLSKLSKILTVLTQNSKYTAIANLPFMAKKAFSNEYRTNLSNDEILIRSYLQAYYFDSNSKKQYLDSLDDIIVHFKYEQRKQGEKYNRKNKTTKDYTPLKTSQVINLYMQFVYSTFEYFILPIVNIGLDIYAENSEWSFGDNVLKSLQDVKSKYYRKIFGGLNIDELSEKHLKILNALKDYGLGSTLRRITIPILNEIEERINIRYSTTDILNAIRNLSMSSSPNRNLYSEIVRKYIN